MSSAIQGMPQGWPGNRIWEGLSQAPATRIPLWNRVHGFEYPAVGLLTAIVMQ